jgi:small subunit ribosomal protein S20
MRGFLQALHRIGPAVLQAVDCAPSKPITGAGGAGTNEDSNQMANTAQARKRARQAEVTRQRNASQKSALRTAVKKVKKAIAAGDKTAAGAVFRESQAVIDRIADKRIVHKNLASRTKSRLVQAIKALA